MLRVLDAAAIQAIAYYGGDLVMAGVQVTQQGFRLRVGGAATLAPEGVIGEIATPRVIAAVSPADPRTNSKCISGSTVGESKLPLLDQNAGPKRNSILRV